MILCANPKAQYQAHKAEIDQALLGVLERGRYILGDECRLFEQEFAAYCGVAHAVGVGSGTEALHLALKACGIGAGDEVITVAHTAVATVAAIEQAGATPVFVDIEPDFFTLDAGRLERAITPKTKAVVPVHLYGQMADMPAIMDIARRHGLRVIEDCAQSHGAAYRDRRAGSWGDMACFSFYPTKNLGALGDGGAVVTSDKVLAKDARLLREYGWEKRYVSSTVGWNTRLDEIQAAVLRVKLRHLDEDNASRRRIAGLYAGSLGDCDLQLPAVRASSSHVFHLFVVRSRRRDDLLTQLQASAVQALIHYPVPIHLQPAYAGRLPGASTLPETERAAVEILSLPMYPELSEEDTRTVIAAVRALAARARSSR